MNATLQAEYLQSAMPQQAAARGSIRYRTVEIDGVDISYRDAGPADAPALLLLHGFPSSSHQYRNLVADLADRYRVVAPDYPGFGHSAAPDRSTFAYTFDNFAGIVDKLTEALGLDRYALYVFDYGAPVGFRLATKHPDRVSAIIVQNGNAYDEGIADFWNPIKAYWGTNGMAEREAIRWLTSLKATHWQYINGVPEVSRVSPDGWTSDQGFMDRPGNADIQLDIFYDYRNNIPLYPQWQAYFRNRRPPMLVIWGKNDEIFVAPGAAPYGRDNPDAEIHMLDTGHFALETHGAEIAGLIREFLGRKVG